MASPHQLLTGAGIQGLQGLAFDENDKLHTASLLSQKIYTVDLEKPGLKVLVDAPQGHADDIAFGPQGIMVWTALAQNEVRAKSPTGEVRTLANIMSPTALCFGPDNRLYVAAASAIWEVFLDAKPAQKLADIGGLNAFDFGPDGKIYAPLMNDGQVIRIDPSTWKVETVAGLFRLPGAVRFDTNGNLRVLDAGRGEVVQLDYKTGAREGTVYFQPGIDKLAFDSKGQLYVTSMGDSSIFKLTNQGAPVAVFNGGMSLLGGVAISKEDAEPVLYVANFFDLRAITLGKQQTQVLGRLWVDWGASFKFSCYLDVGKRSLVTSDPISGCILIMDRLNGLRRGILEGFNEPHGLALMGDNDEQLVIAEYGAARVVCISVKTGERLWEKPFEGGPHDIAVCDNHAYVSEINSGFISRIDLKSKNRPTTVISRLSAPAGLDLMADGRLFVIDTEWRMLLEIVSGEYKILQTDLQIGAWMGAGSPDLGANAGVAAHNGTVYYSLDMLSSVVSLDV